MGVVLRDYKGNFIAASCIYLPHASATMVEATTMKEGLALAFQAGVQLDS
jgi:hypothetical protein